MSKIQKVAVIGLDCAITPLIERHIKEGHLPTFKKLFESGTVADNCLCPYPTVTPPNWASIGTGAWPGTHCITDFHVHLPGKTPDNTLIVQAFNSERNRAEFLWDAADKAGKKCIVLNYPGSWPSHMKNGIMVGGSSLTVGDNRDGLPFMNHSTMLCGDLMITTGVYPQAIRGSFGPAKSWKNLPDNEDEPLEMAAKMIFREAAKEPVETVWYVLARKSGKKDGYDSVSLSPTRDLKDAFCTLSVGGWGPRVVTRIKMKDGTECEAFFRCKLIDLSEDAEEFRLFISAIGTLSGWSSPPEAAADIQSENGIIGHSGGVLGYQVGWYDLDTFVEVNELYTQWLADAATSLLSKHEWDLFFMHAHSPDWMYHLAMTDMNLDPKKDRQKYDIAWDAHLKVYEAQDRMIEQIMKTMGKDTLVILVSDHGAVADGATFNPYVPLVEAGLSVIPDMTLQKTGGRVTQTDIMKAGMAKQPDASKSKALPERECYVYVHLKGRDPEGIVDPADYETVQRQIIDALLSYVDPVTGKRPVALALSKKDARIIGLHGDDMGDVVYALYPEFAGQHGNILPAAEWGCGSLKPLLSFTGPGIKKGHRMQRTCNLVDIVPTICYLTDLPIPAQAEGAVLYQSFQDPNFKGREVEKLKAGLARMETALQRGERQPWDKHECA